MKKFSSISQKDKIGEQPSTLQKTIEKLIKECILVKIENEPNLNLDYSLQGKEELLESVITFIENTKKKVSEITLEKNKQLNAHYINLFELNQHISCLQKELEKYEVIPSPEDIFASEDYQIIGESMVLENISKIPLDHYVDYLKDDNIHNFFEKHKIKIKDLGSEKGWEILFDPNLEDYIGTMTEKWRSFVLENRDFIADFLKATTNLVGVEKTLIDNRIR
jgi:hypothetical protein